MGNFFSNDEINNTYDEDNKILQTDVATNMIIDESNNNNHNQEINYRLNYLKYKEKYLKEKQLYINKK